MISFQKFKVVFDSNTFISALVFSGIAKELFENKSHLFSICYSEISIEEIKDKLFAKFGFDESDLFYFYELLQSLGYEYHVDIEIDACRDPKDNFVLALAQVAGADYIVTGDKDLLILQKWNNTRIVDLRKFDNILKEY